MNQTEFAKALGVEQGTISRWENGGIPSFENVKMVASFADHNGYPFEYLNSIVQRTAVDELRKARPWVPIVGRIGDDFKIGDANLSRNNDLEDVEAPPSATSLTAALLIVTDRMSDIAPKGSLLYFERRHANPKDAVGGKLAVVTFADGSVHLGRLLSAPGRSFYFCNPTNHEFYTITVAHADRITGARYWHNDMH